MMGLKVIPQIKNFILDEDQELLAKVRNGAFFSWLWFCVLAVSQAKASRPHQQNQEALMHCDTFSNKKDLGMDCVS